MVRIHDIGSDSIEFCPQGLVWPKPHRVLRKKLTVVVGAGGGKTKEVRVDLSVEDRQPESPKQYRTATAQGWKGKRRRIYRVRMKAERL